jgi:Protein of unknown function (DUF3830)
MSHSRGPGEGELLFAYGHRAFASRAGALAGSHVATLVEGCDRLAEPGRLTLREGARALACREA